MSNYLEVNRNKKNQYFCLEKQNKSYIEYKKNITMTMSGLPFIIALVVPRLDDFSAKKKIVNICSYA